MLRQPHAPLEFLTILQTSLILPSELIPLPNHSLSPHRLPSCSALSVSLVLCSFTFLPLMIPFWLERISYPLSVPHESQSTFFVKFIKVIKTSLCPQICQKKACLALQLRALRGKKYNIFSKSWVGKLWLTG